MTPSAHTGLDLPAEWHDLFALTKPRVMSLAIFTALCGMFVAPVQLHPVLGFSAILAIALGAGAAGALNQWYEADLDARMKRTAKRPLPAKKIKPQTALHFGVGLAAFSVLLLWMATNSLAALGLAGSILFYMLVYTVWLKPRTPQNIVIGGAAGALPPLIGWVAATGQVALLPLLMFLIIFLWTPPHFWSLALFMRSDYAAAGIPMLPVAAGEDATRRQILLYALLMTGVAVSPWILELAGDFYGLSAGALSMIFVFLSLKVAFHRTGEGTGEGTGEDDQMIAEKQLFAYSILYLFLLFAALVADRWWFQ